MPKPCLPPEQILEAAVYADDLDAAERFYRDVLGFTVAGKREDRHVFFRVGRGMFLVFRAEATRQGSSDVDIPAHGARGPGHVAFAMRERDLDDARTELEARGVEIERDLDWPGGGRSLYFRDPAGNSIELVTPRLWGFEEGEVFD